MQRGALLPVLRRSVGRDQQRIAAVAAEQRARAPAGRIGFRGGAEGKPVLRIEAVLVLGGGAGRLGEGGVREHLAGTRGVGERAVEHAAAALVLVHAELDEGAHEAAALGNAEHERMAGPRIVAAAAERRIRRALGIGALVAQERHDVPGGCETHAHHLRRRGIVPQFVDRDRLELPAGGHQPDRPAVLEAPAAGGNFGAGVALARAHGEPRHRRVERGGGIVELGQLRAGAVARAELELLADAAHDLLAVLGRHRKARGDAAIGLRSIWVPARPHDGVAAAQREAEAGIEDGAGIVVVRRGFVDACQQGFAAAIVHLVEDDAIAAAGIERTQDEEIGLVFDEAARIARRLVEIDDRLVLRRLRIELAPGGAAHTLIGAGLAERLALRERLDGVDLDLGDAGVRRTGQRRGDQGRDSCGRGNAPEHRFLRLPFKRRLRPILSKSGCGSNRVERKAGWVGRNGAAHRAVSPPAGAIG